MKCPDCVKEGKRSNVYVGYCTQTLMCSNPYYDQEGIYHHNDPNITTTNYSCSEGHKWQEKSQYGKIIEVRP